MNKKFGLFLVLFIAAYLMLVLLLPGVFLEPATI